MEWIGRRVEVRETKGKIEIQLDARRLVTHRRTVDVENQRITLAEHRTRPEVSVRRGPIRIRKRMPFSPPRRGAGGDDVAALKQRSRKVITLALRQLLRLCANIRASRFWARWARPPVTVFTIWTGWSA